MKIAFVFDAMLYGGIERVGINYIQLLEKAGHDITVFILNPNDVEGIVDEIPKSCKIIRKRISPFLCPERYWYIAKRWWWGKYFFPIVHLMLRVLMEIYKVCFFHSEKYDIAIAFAGHFNDLSFVAYGFVKSNKKICWLHGGLYSYMIISPGFERLYGKIKNLVVLNNLVEHECLFFNKFLHFNIRKIYNPTKILERVVNLQRVEQLKSKYGDFILMIARMSIPKNPISVIRAMEYVSSKYAVNRHLVFVGDGDMMADIKEYICNSPISEYCHLEGNDANPQDYYKAAHIFAFSSLTEGLPTVLIEAACFGLPIVTSDTSVREILGDGKYGLISPIDDYIDLGENLYSIIENDSLYNKYSQLSYQRSADFLPHKISRELFDYMSNLK